MELNDLKELPIAEVARKLRVSVATVNNWYYWYNNDAYAKPEFMPELPQPKIVDGRGTRLWSKNDVKQLIGFMKWRPMGRNGVMGEYYAKYRPKPKSKE